MDKKAGLVSHPISCIEKGFAFRTIPKGRYAVFAIIGARAQWGHMSAGPGGAAFQLMFTTSDGKYDIKTLISNLLPENVESPDLGLEQIAKAISNRYDKVATH